MRSYDKDGKKRDFSARPVRTRKSRKATKLAAPKYLELRGWEQLMADPHISLAAKGLAGMLAVFSGLILEHVLECSANGEAAIRSALRELEQAGYAVRGGGRNPDGTLDWSITLIHGPDHPLTTTHFSVGGK